MFDWQHIFWGFTSAACITLARTCICLLSSCFSQLSIVYCNFFFNSRNLYIMCTTLFDNPWLGSMRRKFIIAVYLFHIEYMQPWIPTLLVFFIITKLFSIKIKYWALDYFYLATTHYATTMTQLPTTCNRRPLWGEYVVYHLLSMTWKCVLV